MIGKSADGPRVDYPDGFGLACAANTTPVDVLRVEGENEAALERIKHAFRKALHQIKPEAKLPFQACAPYFSADPALKTPRLASRAPSIQVEPYAAVNVTSGRPVQAQARVTGELHMSSFRQPVRNGAVN